MRPRSEAHIRHFIAERSPGEPFVPADLATCGTRSSVDQALGRLTRAGVITRVSRGMYVRPRQSTLLGNVPVSALAAGQAYARARHSPTVPTGPQVLAEYGLSTQTPVTTVLGTDLPGHRHVPLGAHTVIFQRSPKYVLRHAGTALAGPLAALASLGKSRSDDCQTLITRLERSTFEALLTARPDLPG